MHSDLAPVRRAQASLRDGRSTDETLQDLRFLFDLDYAGAMAAVAAAALLSARGMELADEPIVRPYVSGIAESPTAAA